MRLNPYRVKIRFYWAALRRTAHVRLWLANAMSGSLPDFVSGAIRGRLYRLAGFDIGPGAFIMGNLELSTGLSGMQEKLVIGAGCVLGTHVAINLDAPVFIGSNVSIGPYVLIYTGTHQIGFGSQRRQSTVLAKPVRVEDGSWIGLGAIILPGVTIGHGSIVAAGAVVTQSVPANSYVEGNPAAIVRELPWGDR